MKKPSQVLPFPRTQAPRAWRRFQLLPVRTSLDPTQPLHYVIEAQGERNDGTVFAVCMAIGKALHDLLHGEQAMRAVIEMTNKALQQLQTYTDCECKEGKPCEQHKQVVH